MYDQRALVRWMAMRRTLFVFRRDDIPMVQSAVSTPPAAVLRRRLLTLLERNHVDEDWLPATEKRVEQALQRRRPAAPPRRRDRHPGRPHSRRTPLSSG